MLSDILKRLRNAVMPLGLTVGVGGLLWLIWLPVLGDYHDFFLPLAVAWTGCIIGAAGAFIHD